VRYRRFYFLEWSFLYTRECRHLYERPAYSIGDVPCGQPLSLQYCKPPRGWKLISGISAVELNRGTILGTSWLSRKFHQLELLIYCWESVKGGQLSAKVPKRKHSSLRNISELYEKQIDGVKRQSAAFRMRVQSKQAEYKVTSLLLLVILGCHIKCDIGGNVWGSAIGI